MKQLPLLGATFSVGDYSTPTWEPAVNSLETRLSAWAGRQLSFQGKTVVINSLALSQVWHLCYVFPVPFWAGRRINMAVWKFFWSGKRDLVALTTVSLPKARGGFGVINFKDKAAAIFTYCCCLCGFWTAFCAFFRGIYCVYIYYIGSLWCFHFIGYSSLTYSGISPSLLVVLTWNFLWMYFPLCFIWILYWPVFFYAIPLTGF